jgi:hypothetical protein
VLGYGGHCDGAERVPGEERIIKLFGNGERGEVPWLCRFVPFGRVISIKIAPAKMAVHVHFRQSIRPRDIAQLRQDRAYARLC